MKKPNKLKLKIESYWLQAFWRVVYKSKKLWEILDLIENLRITFSMHYNLSYFSCKHLFKLIIISEDDGK